MSKATIGIIGAMSEEIEMLEAEATIAQSFMRAGITFTKAQLHGVDLVFCKSGVGKVNAAVCTQLLLDFGVEAVWFTGVAGALDPALDVGDLVISSSCQQHDMDVTALGFARGVIPFQELSDFPAAPALIELAQHACEQLFPGRYCIGRVLSGDQFIANRDTVRLLHETMGGTCVEMEGAAVAQVCAMHEVPYVVIRSMSDKADGSAHVSFTEFTRQAALHSHQLIAAMLQTWQARRV